MYVCERYGGKEKRTDVFILIFASDISEPFGGGKIRDRRYNTRKLTVCMDYVIAKRSARNNFSEL